MDNHIVLWVGFNVFIVLMVMLDIFVFNKRVKALKVREALILTGFWVLLAALFGLGVYWRWGQEQALEYATGYIIEQSLSVDNLFVILMLFTYFRTPTAFQQKVLMWGIFGVIFFRIIFIFAGVAIIQDFSFATYILGAFLVFSSVKMLFNNENDVDPDKNIVMRIFRKFIPVTRFYEGSKFFTRQNKVLHATPLFVALIVIETTDIIFALDSIPAVIAVSKHSFIIYSSNIFAVLGLRALYFALAGVMQLFHFLRYGLSTILIFIGAKILLAGVLKAHHIIINIQVDLTVIGCIILLSVVFSLLFPEKNAMPKHE